MKNPDFSAWKIQAQQKDMRHARYMMKLPTTIAPALPQRTSGSNPEDYYQKMREYRFTQKQFEDRVAAAALCYVELFPQTELAKAQALVAAFYSGTISDADAYRVQRALSKLHSDGYQDLGS